MKAGREFSGFVPSWKTMCVTVPFEPFINPISGQILSVSTTAAPFATGTVRGSPASLSPVFLASALLLTDFTTSIGVIHRFNPSSLKDTASALRPVNFKPSVWNLRCWSGVRRSKDRSSHLFQSSILNVPSDKRRNSLRNSSFSGPCWRIDSFNKKHSVNSAYRRRPSSCDAVILPCPS